MDILLLIDWDTTSHILFCSSPRKPEKETELKKKKRWGTTGFFLYFFFPLHSNNALTRTGGRVDLLGENHPSLRLLNLDFQAVCSTITGPKYQYATKYVAPADHPCQHFSVG